MNRGFGWKSFNDRLALGLLFFLIPLFWLLDARGIIEVQSEVNGALISTWTALVLYYFRRAPPADGAPPTP